MMDWADDIGRAFIDSLDASELDLIEGSNAPFQRLAALLRKAKADGYRMGADEWEEYGTTKVANEIEARAAEIEKGNA